MLAGILLSACNRTPERIGLTATTEIRFRKPASYYPQARCILAYYDDSLRGQEYFYFLDRASNTLLHTRLAAAPPADSVFALQRTSLAHLFHHTPYPLEAMGVFAPDSLVFVDGGVHSICLTNAQGQVRQQWQPRAPIYGRTPYFITTGFQPVYTKGSRLYLHAGPDDVGNITADTMAFHRLLTYKTGLVLDVRDTLFANNFTGEFPGFLSAKNNFNIVAPQSCVTPEGDYLFTYGSFSQIYRYALSGHKQVTDAPSRYHRPARGLPFSSLKNHQDLIGYKLTEPEYGPLLSDPYRRRYLRVYRHGLPAALNQPVRPSYADIPWSLLILDAGLNVVGEVPFAPTYDPDLILVTRRGVLIGNHRPEHAGYNPQQLSFLLFTYQPLQAPSS